MRKSALLILALALAACDGAVHEFSDESLVPVQIVGLYDYDDGGVGVFLKGAGAEMVPIIIGRFEAQALQLAMSNLEAARPLPYNLFGSLLQHMDGAIQKLVVHSIQSKVFHAYLEIRTDGKTIQMDCRPSDGMVLATRAKAQIFVTKKVLQESGTDLLRAKKIRWDGR